MRILVSLKTTTAGVFGASLVYRVSSRTARGYTEKPCLEKPKKKKKEKEKKDENGHHRLICLNTWFPADKTVWEGLGGVSLGVGFEV